MRRGLLLIAAAALLCTGAPAMAQKKTLAVVVKGLDNPFFKAVGRGCDDWNKDNAKSDYECVNAGPESSIDSAGQIQIVEKLMELWEETRIEEVAFKCGWPGLAHEHTMRSMRLITDEVIPEVRRRIAAAERPATA